MRRSPIVFKDDGLLQELQIGDSLTAPNRFVEDFMGISLADYTTVVSGGGSLANKNTITYNGSMGVLLLRTGTGATTSTIVHAGQNNTRIGGGYAIGFGCRVRMPIASNSTNRFTLRFGLGSAVGTIGDQTGIYFRYNDSVAGGVITGVVRNGVTESVSFSGIPMLANTNYDLYYLVNPTGTGVDFFVNGVQIVPTITSNLPLNTTPLGIFSSMQKSVGTGVMDCYVDTWYLESLK